MNRLETTQSGFLPKIKPQECHESLVKILFIFLAIQSFGQKKKETNVKKTDYNIVIAPEKWEFQAAKVTFSWRFLPQEMGTHNAARFTWRKRGIFPKLTATGGIYKYNFSWAYWFGQPDSQIWCEQKPENGVAKNDTRKDGFP